jgi:uncharacterized FlgJ-related protein
MNERHLKETIQRQADKIKELEADWLDEYTKGQMKSKEIEKLNKILYYFDVKLKNNTEYQQLKSDLIGGQEEQIKPYASLHFNDVHSSTDSFNSCNTKTQES